MNLAEAERRSLALADLMSDVEGAVHKAEAGLADQLQGTAANGVSVPESRVHPHILLLASECGGGTNTRAVSLGVTVELLHIALLLHDGVRDDDTRADVRPDDGAKWARNTSVLRGDYLLATAVGRLSADGNISFLSDLIEVLRQMCEGQARFLRTRGSLLETEEYLDTLRMRAGALPAFAARAGFLIAGGPPQHAEAFHAFGERFGVAFHLAGEILDLIEDRPESLERVLARDGWRTLPVAVTARIGERERAELEAILAKGGFSPHDLAHLRRLAEDSGAIRRCWGIVWDWLADAVSRLAPIPETPAKSLLVKTAGDLCGDRRSAELDRLRPARL